MNWRARAGLAIAILAILGVGFQPVSRWVAVNTLSRCVAGQVRIEGNSHWDPWQLVWTCDQLEIEPGQGEPWHAERMTVRLDPQEFLRRNLVIDSAHIDGLRIETRGEAAWGDLDRSELAPELPAFSIEHWLDTALAHQKSAILSASQSRDLRRRELQQQWNDLRELCQVRAKMVDSNPYRARQIDDQIRQETSKLSQALAEERIRVRELDFRWKQWSSQWRHAWQDQLFDSISQAVPCKSTSVHQVVKNSVCEHWNAYRSLVSVASQTTRPIREVPSNTRGADLALPGLPRNHTLVRMAHLTGRIDGSDGNSLRFRAQVNGLGDGAMPVEPTSEWQFEPITEDARDVILVSVARNRNPDADEHPCIERQNLAWSSNLESDLVSKAAWTRSIDGEHLEVSFPTDVLTSCQNSRTRGSDTVSDWEACWDRAVQSHRGRQVVARWSVPSSGVESGVDPHRIRDLELAPETITLSEAIWDEAESLYIDRLVQRAEPRIPVVASAIEAFLAHSWTSGMLEHLDALSDLELEMTGLKTR